MNTNVNVNQFPALGAHLLGVLLIAGAVAFSMGIKLPGIGTYRAALVVLLPVGLFVCSLGGLGRISAARAWFHPISIVGCLIGVLILIITGASLLKKPLPMITGERASFILVTGLFALKMILTQLYFLIR